MLAIDELATRFTRNAKSKNQIINAGNYLLGTFEEGKTQFRRTATSSTI